METRASVFTSKAPGRCWWACSPCWAPSAPEDATALARSRQRSAGAELRNGACRRQIGHRARRRERSWGVRRRGAYFGPGGRAGVARGRCSGAQQLGLSADRLCRARRRCVMLYAQTADQPSRAPADAPKRWPGDCKGGDRQHCLASETTPRARGTCATRMPARGRPRSSRRSARLRRGPRGPRAHRERQLRAYSSKRLASNT